MQNEAKEFASDNLSDRDAYQVIYFNSIVDIFKEISYGEKVEKGLVTDPDINGLHNHEGNDFTDALIEHIEQQQSIFNSQLKTNVMNNENFQYLNDNNQIHGFWRKPKSRFRKKHE